MTSMLNDIIIVSKKIQMDQIIHLFEVKFGPYCSSAAGKLVLDFLIEQRDELDERIKEEVHLDET